MMKLKQGIPAKNFSGSPRNVNYSGQRKAIRDALMRAGQVGGAAPKRAIPAPVKQRAATPAESAAARRTQDLMQRSTGAARSAMPRVMQTPKPIQRKPEGFKPTIQKPAPKKRPMYA